MASEGMTLAASRTGEKPATKVSVDSHQKRDEDSPWMEMIRSRSDRGNRNVETFLRLLLSAPSARSQYPLEFQVQFQPLRKIRSRRQTVKGCVHAGCSKCPAVCRFLGLTSDDRDSHGVVDQEHADH